MVLPYTCQGHVKDLSRTCQNRGGVSFYNLVYSGFFPHSTVLCTVYCVLQIVLDTHVTPPWRAIGSRNQKKAEKRENKKEKSWVPCACGATCSLPPHDVLMYIPPDFDHVCRCVLCTVYCVLCTVYCVLCTVYCVLCTVYCVLCTVYCVLCTVYCVLCTVYCVLCTVYCVLCTVYCVLCTVYCVLCTVYCVLCTVYCVLCTVYCVLCTVYCVRRKRSTPYVGAVSNPSRSSLSCRQNARILSCARLLLASVTTQSKCSFVTESYVASLLM